MQWIYVKMILRGWKRNKLYAVISELSLIIGLSCSVLLAGHVVNEYTASRSIRNGEDVYLLYEKNQYHDSLNYFFTGSMVPVYLQRLFPEVKETCTFYGVRGVAQWKDQSTNVEEYYAVTPGYTDFFPTHVLMGNLQSTLKQENELAVSESWGKKLFGEENPCGQSLSIRYYDLAEVNGQTRLVQREKIYTVTTVFEDMRNGFIHCNMMRGLSQDELTTEVVKGNGVHAFIRLEPGCDAEKFQEKMNQASLIQKEMGQTELLLPAEQVYFTQGEARGPIRYRNPILLWIGMSVALAILIIACFNYINISMTRALQRLKNTGQQMVCGATESHIRRQLTLETFMHVVLAFGISVIVVWYILPFFNQFLGTELSMKDILGGRNLGMIIGLLLFISVAPSLYIYYRLMRMRLGEVLKQEAGRKTVLIRGMVIAQFAISLTLIILVLNVYRQMNFIGHSRPGSDRVVCVWPRLTTEEDMNWREFREYWDVYVNRLKALPEIEAASATKMTQNMSGKWNGMYYRVFDCDEGFFKVYDVQALQGRAFRTIDEHSPEVLVNETFARTIGKDKILGAHFEYEGRLRTVVGVVKDFPIDVFTLKIPPMVFVPNPIGAVDGQIYVKIKEAQDMGLAMKKIREMWKEIAPMYTDVSTYTMADYYQQWHESEMRLMKILEVFMYISLVLTCLGLFGLAWYTVENRKKEISLRKINGATEKQVIRLICRRFIGWILLSAVFALPVAFYFTRQWLMSFVYKADMSLGTYVAALVFVLTVGILTVLWQAWQAAIVNPVEALKSE